MPELYVVEYTEEQFADLFESELQFAMRAFLDQYSRGLQFVDAVEAEKCIALSALMWLGRHLVANHALQYGRIDLYVLRTSTIKLDLGLGQLLYDLLNLCVPRLHPCLPKCNFMEWRSYPCRFTQADF